MATIDWHTLLVTQIPMAPAVAAKLSHQLVSQARALAGITVDDGGYAIAPPDHAFTVQYTKVDGVTIASIEVDLIGLDMAHPAVLAWRSTAGADLELTPQRSAGDLEFFWLAFPAAELARPKRIDTGDWLVRNRFRFDVDLEELYSLPDIWLRFTTRTAFTPEEVTNISAAIGAGIAAWNIRGQTFVHYCSEPEIPADRRTVAVHIDLGSALLDGLAAIIRAVDASSAGAAVGRCYVGREICLPSPGSANPS